MSRVYEALKVAKQTAAVEIIDGGGGLESGSHYLRKLRIHYFGARQCFEHDLRGASDN